MKHLNTVRKSLHITPSSRNTHFENIIFILIFSMNIYFRNCLLDSKDPLTKKSYLIFDTVIVVTRIEVL